MPFCCSCGHRAISFRVEDAAYCELCGVALEYVHAGDLRPKTAITKPRLAREFAAFVEDPSDFQRLGFWPVRVDADQRAYVVCGPDSPSNSVAGIRRLFPVTSVQVMRGLQAFVHEIVDRLAPFIEPPLFPAFEVAGLRPVPGLIAMASRSFVSRRDALPLRRRQDGTLVVATVEQPLSDQELCALFGAKAVETIRISGTEYRDALRHLPWGEPLRFAS
jgi:hypothetical protein